MVRIDATIIAAIIAAVSIIGGCSATRAAMKSRDEYRATATAANAALSECRGRMETLVRESQAREAAASAALADARKAAKTAAPRADYQLSKPAAAPGDDCRSAKLRAHEWLEGRR